jgi:hypothetical protein
MALPRIVASVAVRFIDVIGTEDRAASGTGSASEQWPSTQE